MGFPIEKQTYIIGVAGNRGSFSEEACEFYLKENSVSNPQMKYLYTTSGVLEQLEEHHIDAGIFPITNSVSGVILESLEAVAAYTFSIQDVFDMPVKYGLLARSDARLEQITTIMSHPSIIESCRAAIEQKYPGKLIEVGEGILIDQATAAEYLAQPGSPSQVAVIAPLACARLYHLQILDKNVEPQESFTTFVWCHPK